MSDRRLGSLRLVCVTPGDRAAPATEQLVRQVLEGGVTAVLLREPQLAARERAALYAACAAHCRRAGALALVSREPQLAVDCGADGVQLGHASPDVATARRLAPGLLVGRSAHWPLQPDDLVADYLLLSPFRPTPRSLPRPLLTPAQVQEVLGAVAPRPVVALGGLSAASVQALPEGLAGVAVLSALGAARDARTQAAELRSVVDAWLAFGAAVGGGAG